MSLGVLIYDDLRLGFFFSQMYQCNGSRSGFSIERLHVYAPTADSSIGTHLDFIQSKAGVVSLGHGKGNLGTRNQLMAYQVPYLVLVAKFPQHAKESIRYLVQRKHGPMDIVESRVT